jgi:holo-[acyl-carrier protein] synthase
MSVGVDIESIDRFRRKNYLEKAFLKKIFTPRELGYCFNKIDSAPCLTTRFAGKEAVIKALGGLNIRVNYLDVEILSKNKVPVVSLKNRKYHKIIVLISLSHCEDKAIAFVISIKTLV